ncbi:Uncharacterised protein [Mycobacteroides abscessus subsp. abscessus]|nr:Uncharacterised protein [Mycobacteroides abscessus subsp. abscessus]
MLGGSTGAGGGCEARGLTRFDCGLFYLNVDHARLFRGDVLAIVSEPRDE